MRDTEIVAGRYHVVMADQRLIAQRLIFFGVAVQVAEWRRETYRCDARVGRQTAPSRLGKSAPPGRDERRSGYAVAPPVPPRCILILIGAAVSP